MGTDADGLFEDVEGDPLWQAARQEQPAKTPKRKEWRRLYTLLPRAWEVRLLGAKRVVTYRLAVELLYLHWLSGGKPIAVTGKVAEAAKLSDRSKWNALAELERLGLIEVDRRPRRSPRATPLQTQAPES